MVRTFLALFFDVESSLISNTRTAYIGIMARTVETTLSSEDKHSFNWGAFVLWIFGILLIYIASVGPILMLVEKKVVLPNSAWLEIYAPVERAYYGTFLHKPIGMYLHLWSKRFDENGDTAR